MRIVDSAVLSALLVSAAGSVKATPGDVNADGVVTLSDAVIASRLAGNVAPLTPGQVQAADVAGPAGDFRDLRVDWRDVARITRIAARLERAPDAPVPQLQNIVNTLLLSADASRDYTFTAGSSPSGDSVLVRGHVSRLPPETKLNSIRFVQMRQGGFSSSGTSVDENGDYSLMLKPAEYHLYSGGVVSETQADGTLQWDYIVSLDQSIQVTGPTTLNLTAASVPTPGTVTGSVHSTNVVPTSAQGQPLPPRFPQNPSPTDSSSPITGIATADAYTLKGMPATYAPRFRAIYQPDPKITFDWYPGSDLTIPAGSAEGPDYTLPSAVPVSFAFTLPANTSLESATLRNLSDRGTVGLMTTAALPTGSSVYSTAFAPGAAQLSFVLRPDDAGNADSTINASLQTTVPEAGGAEAVDLPAVPAMVTYSGHVAYPGGVPAAGVAVSLNAIVSSQKPVPFYTMNVRATTDADGQFSLRAIPGQYQFSVAAP